MAGKDVRALQLNHALPNSVPLFTVVALNSTIAVQSFQASPKLVPRIRLTAGKEVSLLQLRHELLKLIESLGSVLNVTTGKEVKLA